MTTPFYAPPTCFRDGRVTLPPDEARHVLKVLRHRAGDEVVVVDGVGGWHRVVLTEAGREQVTGEVMETRREVGEAGRNVVLALGILHHRDRFEWAVEKAVELGVAGIVPLRSRRAAPGRVRADRLEHIAVAAMKQSLRCVLPHIYPETYLADALRLLPEARVLLAHEALESAPTPAQAADASTTLVLIGPEGGFDEVEVAEAAASGARLVTLGPNRLRAETAALVALTDLMLHTR